MAVTQAEWRTRARRLADDLRQSGALADAAWYDAFATTPRHLFVPSFSIDNRKFDRTEPVDIDSWLDVVYRDDALLTQTTQHRPSSSSSKPAIMAVMLSLLEITGTERILEIGTGTGYNAALLASRLGAGRVTSIDIDPSLVDDARQRLAEFGATPLLVAGDGSSGWTSRAPYDRIIATCAIHYIPPAWIHQLVEGGRIIAPLTGPGGALMVLDKIAADEVHGRFDPRPAQFMPLRHYANDPLGPGESVGFSADGMPHYGTTTLDPQILVDASAALALFCRLHLPGMTIGAERSGSGSVIVHTTDAMAEVLRTPLSPGSWQVIQRGPYRCWDSIEAAINTWHSLDRPGHSRFGITALDVTDRQFVWLDDPNGTHSWPLR
ncbi:MAG: methyltransferase domain-containing protein [Pseudonocardia sp.]